MIALGHGFLHDSGLSISNILRYMWLVELTKLSINEKTYIVISYECKQNMKRCNEPTAFFYKHEYHISNIWYSGNRFRSNSWWTTTNSFWVISTSFYSSQIKERNSLNLYQTFYFLCKMCWHCHVNWF